MRPESARVRWAAAPRLGTLIFLILGACLQGCGGDPEPTAPDWPAAALRVMRAGRAPTPYTADQIRAACPDGRSSTYRLEGGGTKPITQRFTFRESDAEGTRLWLTVVDAAGQPLRVPAARRETWRGLQRHASYPEALTTITDETIEVPAGRFNCMLYTVEAAPDADAGAVKKVTKAWFARELPGPPVRMEEWWDGQLHESMTLIEHTMPDGP